MRIKEPFRGQSSSAGSIQLLLKEKLQDPRMRQQSHMLHMAVQPWLKKSSLGHCTCPHITEESSIRSGILLLRSLESGGSSPR